MPTPSTTSPETKETRRKPGVPRLNRRRYRESVAALKQIISCPQTTQARKLQSINILLGIFDRSDRSASLREQRERAAKAALAGEALPVETAPESTESTESTEDVVERFLEAIREKRR